MADCPEVDYTAEHEGRTEMEEVQEVKTLVEEGKPPERVAASNMEVTTSETKLEDTKEEVIPANTEVSTSAAAGAGPSEVPTSGTEG